MFVDDPLRRDDFQIGDLVFIIAPVRAMHHKPPHAAGADIHAKRRGGKSFGPPPISDVLGICPNHKYKLARRIKDARGNDLSITHESGGLVCFIHLFSP